MVDLSEEVIDIIKEIKDVVKDSSFEINRFEVSESGADKEMIVLDIRRKDD